MIPEKKFQPFVPASVNMKELTVKAILLGSLFGVIFGAATVYLALKAGLTVSASIPIAVIAITLGRKFFKTTILENNIIQTTGSAGESIAGGVAFTLPAFLFLSAPDSADYFNYLTILILAIVGGLLGTLLMIPLRKALIVNEHKSLPYPEGTACGDVLIAGEKGGDFAKTAFWGLGVAFLYAILQKLLHFVAEVPYWTTQKANKYFPSARVSGEITPEYLGVGYIIGPKISGVLVAGGVLSWLVLIPLLATLVQNDVIAMQLVKLGYLADITKPGGQGNWNPQTHTFTNYSAAIYYAFIRQIAAGTVAAGGIITLIKTLPTIAKSIKSSARSIKGSDLKEAGVYAVPRTEKDLNIKVVGFGTLGLILLITFLPGMPGDSYFQKALIGLLVVIFGALFVTVSSRIVGLVGSSNNPISGMTIATVMGTSLIFIAVGWSGQAFEPMVLVVGGMICIAASNAGGTSQDLKSGYIVGATPRSQQIALFIGAIVSSIVIGLTIKFLDRPTADMLSKGIEHGIGSDKYPAPQATLIATLIKGIFSDLDWQYVFVGVFVAIVMELCGIKSLSFAVGAYLPLSTTLPIFIGGAIKGIVDRKKEKKPIAAATQEEEELGKGNLFATGLVAGGAIAGVLIAFLSGTSGGERFLGNVNMEHGLIDALSEQGYFLLGVVFFAIMGVMLYRIAMQKSNLKL